MGDFKEAKEAIVDAVSKLIESENYLRLDIINLQKKIQEQTSKIEENTRQLTELNNYFREIKESRNNEQKEDVDDAEKERE